MAKKLLLPILVIFISLAFFANFANKSVQAEAGANIPNGKVQTRDIRGDVREKRQDLKDNSATRQAELKQRVIKRIKKVFGQILARFSAALGRLNKISDKIQSRIKKLKEKGVDVSNAQSMLDSCKAKRSAAEAAIVDAKSKVSAIDPGSSTVRQAVQTAVDAMHSAKKTIGDYHKCLTDVTRTLRVTSKEASNEAK